MIARRTEWPTEILSPLEALTEAAKLNKEALEARANDKTAQASFLANLALSLSTYAQAIYRRES